MCIDQEDNELEVLEIIHHYVVILDRYFGSVCELDLIFNFHKAYYILDELLIAGELQESSKKTVARIILSQDQMVEAAKEEAEQHQIVIHIAYVTDRCRSSQTSESRDCGELIAYGYSRSATSLAQTTYFRAVLMTCGVIGLFWEAKW
ncbi:unnamed protein product [Eruca vesicaria subsp. sativa]|uniref:AP complex mu/sigma subunit domain-containing protein n=1 Tax=Eruca vesicaria subsp. sativa TaxID=29727 RepID=A0ABC8KDP0_ERUVS|nr:unnamed protein product [Eruca vesicaria subsp. sativa]